MRPDLQAAVDRLGLEFNAPNSRMTPEEFARRRAEIRAMPEPLTALADATARAAKRAPRARGEGVAALILMRRDLAALKKEIQEAGAKEKEAAEQELKRLKADANLTASRQFMCLLQLEQLINKCDDLFLRTTKLNDRLAVC
jgi:hypothetical protein